MEKIDFKLYIKKCLLNSAKEYSFYLKKAIYIKNIGFENKKEYIIRFYKTNFLHLTGVKTHLSAAEFYDKCISENIEITDFDCSSTKELKALVKTKIKNFHQFSKFFDHEIFFQERFQKNKVNCIIAATDETKTIGFVDAKYCVRPNTLLSRNCLDKNKKIFKIKGIIKEIS